MTNFRGTTVTDRVKFIKEHPNQILTLLFLSLSAFLLVNWKLAKEEAEMSDYAFRLAASQSSANIGADCLFPLKRLPSLGDEIVQDEDGTTHRWSTFHRMGFVTALLYGRQETGHYRVQITCDSSGNIVRFHYGYE